MRDSVLFIRLWQNGRSMGITLRRVLLCCSLILGMGVAVPALADAVVTVKAVHVPGVSLEAVSANLQDAVDGGVMLQLHAARASVPALGWRRVGLDMEGRLHRDERLRWVFDGGIRLAGAPGGAMSKADVNIVISPSANMLQIDLAQGAARADAALPLDQPTHARINLEKLPAAWFQGLLGTLWSGQVSTGQVQASLALDVRDEGVLSSGEFVLRGIGMDSSTGTLAAQALDANGRFDLDSTRGPAQVDIDASLGGGELLLGPIYAQLPPHPVQLGLRMRSQRGAVSISRLRVNDPDALQLEGALAFDGNGALQSLKLSSLHAEFPAASQRYGQSWLAGLGLTEAQLAGAIDASVDIGSDGARAFAFNTSGMDLLAAGGRLAVHGLRGGLDWNVRGDRAATTLAWDALQFHRVSLGAAQSHWRSHDGVLGLEQVLAVPVLGGQLRVDRLNWRPAAARGQRLDTGLAVTGVDLSALSRALGWPAFPGTLAGAVPSLRWVDDRVEFAGGLSANLFDGFVEITGLSLRDPFGTSPTLAADISLRQLDLAAITSVFDFGSITGRLDGAIEGLRLVAWSPVAFQGQLLAGSGGRISQRAVNNLASVGGGGVAAGLQGAVLKLFKTFGYKRIGLNCTLRGAVCQMSGLEPAADGYTIVEGSGLPHLHVVGHQSRVDWPTLVRRLRDAIHGAPPQVR